MALGLVDIFRSQGATESYRLGQLRSGADMHVISIALAFSMYVVPCSWSLKRMISYAWSLKHDD
jgi:hypothetical protein